MSIIAKLNHANEFIWLRLANLSDQLLEPEKSLLAYENVLRHNPSNINALTQIARIYQTRQQFREAIEFYQRVVSHDVRAVGQPSLGDVWGALGHCYLMIDELKEAYAAYQRALYSSQAAKDSSLWYGIGILYDKCASFDLAEEVFCHILKIDPDFGRKEEVLFRLGMIYKHENKHEKALECFQLLLDKPPPPLSQSDVMFQIGIIYELQGEALKAKEMYEKVLEEHPKHSKIIVQLGWLYQQERTPFHDVNKAIEYMKASVQADPADPQPWYLLGRCYMSQKEYKHAYSAYQQAVYRDEMNPSYWCSIGVLYYQINQFRDALDAYSRSICLNPQQSEVWYDLGTLYESCRQLSDAFDAYSKAADLDPNNPRIMGRLDGLKNAIKMEESGGAGVLQGAASLPLQNKPPLSAPLSAPLSGMMPGGALGRKDGEKLLPGTLDEHKGSSTLAKLADLAAEATAAAEEATKAAAAAAAEEKPGSDSKKGDPQAKVEGNDQEKGKDGAMEEDDEEGGMEIDEGDDDAEDV